MDAANPLCRWLPAVALALIVGCQACERVSIPTIRGQSPGPIAPVAPTTPKSPVGPGSPVVPAAPGVSGAAVPGLPLAREEAETAVKPAGAVAASAAAVPTAAKAAELMKESVPQIRVVALIGASHLVTDQEVIEAVRQRLGEFRDLPGPARAAKEKELYAVELRRIIERELILDDMYAKLKKQGRLGLADEIKEFAEKAADQSLRTIRTGYGLKTEEEFQAVLRMQGLTQQVIRRQIERQIMADEYVRSAIKEKGRAPGFADIRAYYEAHPDEFKSEDRVKWLDIFISLSKHPTPEAARAHAEHVYEKARASKNGPAADFLELVKQYDNGLAAGSGGVGVGSKRGEIQPPDVEKIIWSLKPGELAGPIATPTGYHIVKVAERDHAGTMPFDVKVQNRIREKLLRQYREDEYHKLIEELWRKGAVRVIESPQ
jgi:peptidyl-prolyl cis-trans isomerase SurA